MSNDAWAEALEEAESPDIRDKGLWARCFTEADGDEPRARAAYVRAKVSAAALAPPATPSDVGAEPEDFFCPNCGTPCKKSAESCRACYAVFGPDGWRPLPEKPVVVTPLRMKDLNASNEFGFCPSCTKSIRMDAASCFYCDTVFSGTVRPVHQKPSPPPSAQKPNHQIIKTAKSRGVYIILGLFFGLLGIHNFYAGRFAYGVMQILITAILGWFVIGIFITAIWVIVELFAVTEDGAGDAFA